MNNYKSGEPKLKKTTGKGEVQGALEDWEAVLQSLILKYVLLIL